MQVKQYIFQSPYANQIQIGRLDTSSVKEDESNKPNTNTKEIVDISSKQKQNSIETSQISNILKSDLDIYA